MCDPVTAAVVMTVGATVSQGMAANEQGKYQNSVAKYNARQQQNEATRMQIAANEEENRSREQTQQLLSRQRAQMAANGGVVDAGSNALIQDDTIRQGEVDALRIRSNFGDQINSMRDQAGLTLLDGQASKAAGKNALTSSLISGAAAGLNAGVADKWYQKQRMPSSGVGVA